MPSSHFLQFGNARCVGRLGLGPDDPVCERRTTCLRYLAMSADAELWPNGYPPYVPLYTALCRGGADHYIEASA